MLTKTLVPKFQEVLKILFLLKFNYQKFLEIKSSGRNDFAVSQYYRDLAPSEVADFPCKAIWKPKVPPREPFSLWEKS